METAQVSIDRWIDNMWYIHNVEYYSAFKKEILPISITWVNLEDIMLSEKSQMQKDKYHMSPLLWGIWSNQTDSHRSAFNSGCQQLQREWNEELLHSGFKLSVMLDEYVLETRCTPECLQLTVQYYTFQNLLRR